MYVNVNGPAVDLRDAENFLDLHVRIEGTDRARAEQALQASGFGDLDGDHAWLDVEMLRRVGSQGPTWSAAFDSMLLFASEQGWLSRDGSRLQAHLVHS